MTYTGFSYRPSAQRPDAPAYPLPSQAGRRSCVTIDDPAHGGSDAGAWQRAFDRGCLAGRVGEHGLPVPADDLACPVQLREARARDIHQGRQP